MWEVLISLISSKIVPPSEQGCTCYKLSAPKPTPVILPTINATFNWTPKTNGYYDLSVTLDDNNPSQYSAVLSKCRGCDPGPKTDFYTNTFNFYNVKTGKYYLNVKKEINGYWSTITYYVIDKPSTVYKALPTPTTEPIVKSPYTCNCSKTCPNMSCAEAYYQLNQCGCSARDGDHDGVPCEAQCR